MKIVFLVVALAACGGGNSSKPTTPINTDPVPMSDPPKTDVAKTDPAPPDPKAELLAAETAAFEKAKPVFDKHCARCHSKDGKMTGTKPREHFDMTTYPFGGHHAMEVGKQIRKALGIDGSKPTMPNDKKGSVQGEELALIAKWADAFDASHAGGAHEGHGGHEH